MKKKGPTVDVVNEHLLAEVLRALSRARTLFGGASAAVDPPVFAARADLEDGLGRGTFSGRS